MESKEIRDAAENYRNSTVNKMAIEADAFIAGASSPVVKEYYEDELLAFVKWLDNDAWKEDYREGKSHTTAELLTIFREERK